VSAKKKRGAKRVELDVAWTDRALADLREVGDSIAEDNPVAAERWVGVLVATAEAAATLPRAARVVPEIGRDDVREVFKRTYRVVFRVGERRIEILTIFEGRRRFPPDVIGENGEE
jgi:plasmid stabilization system protein ParE